MRFFQSCVFSMENSRYAEKSEKKSLIERTNRWWLQTSSACDLSSQDITRVRWKKNSTNDDEMIRKSQRTRMCGVVCGESTKKKKSSYLQFIMVIFLTERHSTFYRKKSLLKAFIRWQNVETLASRELVSHSE